MDLVKSPPPVFSRQAGESSQGAGFKKTVLKTAERDMPPNEVAIPRSRLLILKQKNSFFGGRGQPELSFAEPPIAGMLY